MSVDERRWRRHMSDEATAIAAQQVTAGDRHAPIDAPQAYGERELEALAMDQARQARGDCARMLEALVQDYTARGAAEVPIEPLQALVARMLASPQETTPQETPQAP